MPSYFKLNYAPYKIKKVDYGDQTLIDLKFWVDKYIEICYPTIKDYESLKMLRPSVELFNLILV